MGIGAAAGAQAQDDVSKPERRAGIQEYLKARFTWTEIRIPAATAAAQVFQGAVVRRRLSWFRFAAETALGRQAIAGPVVFVGRQYHPRRSLSMPLGVSS